MDIEACQLERLSHYNEWEGSADGNGEKRFIDNEVYDLRVQIDGAIHEVRMNLHYWWDGKSIWSFGSRVVVSQFDLIERFDLLDFGVCESLVTFRHEIFERVKGILFNQGVAVLDGRLPTLGFDIKAEGPSEFSFHEEKGLGLVASSISAADTLPRF